MQNGGPRMTPPMMPPMEGGPMNPMVPPMMPQGEPPQGIPPAFNPPFPQYRQPNPAQFVPNPQKAPMMNPNQRYPAQPQHPTPNGNNLHGTNSSQVLSKKTACK